MIFQYGNKETQYLINKDKMLGDAIGKIDVIKRVVNADIFSSVVYHIIGQQISTKAQETIWKRMNTALDNINAQTLSNIDADYFQQLGMTFRKVEYIINFAKQVESGVLNLDNLHSMSDEDVILKLTKLKGIGVWTVEMILIFCMQRPNIISYGDLAIHRGLRMLYHHRKITPKLFNKYKRRYAPYASVASLYLWAIAGGALPEMRDFVSRSK